LADYLAGGVVPWDSFYLANRLVRCHEEREMTNFTFASDLNEKLGYPNSETIQGLRLLKAFVKLSPSQRSEVINLVEQFATGPAPVPGGVKGHRDAH
jgi:hypothetical protein